VTDWRRRPELDEMPIVTIGLHLTAKFASQIRWLEKRLKFEQSFERQGLVDLGLRPPKLFYRFIPRFGGYAERCEISDDDSAG
jgi:hypothetical protein